MIVTDSMLKLARTKKGGYTKGQIELAKTLYPNKWLKSITGANVSELFWGEFVAKAKKPKKIKTKKKAKIINKMSKGGGDWSWSPEKSDMPPLRIVAGTSKGRKRNKLARAKISRLDSNSFYTSKEWRALRVRVLEKYKCSCMMCVQSPKVHGIVIHVDHIKPRSKRPDLSLDFNNLQLLCEACNMGKSNKYSTDYRPDDSGDSELLDIQLFADKGVFQ